MGNEVGRRNQRRRAAIVLGTAVTVGLVGLLTISTVNNGSTSETRSADRASIARKSIDSATDPSETRRRIPTQPAATVEVTFGSAEDWEGRPRTVLIGSAQTWTPALTSELTNLATRHGSRSTVAIQGTVELLDDRVSDAWAYPVWTIAIDPAAAAELVGPEVGNALLRGEFVLGRAAANIRDAQVGKPLSIAAWDDPISTFQAKVGEIVDDERTLGAEMLVSTAVASKAGLVRPWKVLAWKGDVESVAKYAAETQGSRYVTKSWTPPSVDAVLSPAELKQLLGEFAIERANGVDPNVNGGNITTDPDWLRKNIVGAELPIVGRFNCHRALVKPLQAVFAEIEQAGLADLIDLADTRRAGGCWNSRLIRSATGTSGRNLSRHSWGAAMDLNPRTNAYGANPTIDARLVDVFRRNGFAWGGTFPFPDGMHFEFIGAPRVSGPKLPPGTTSTSTTTTSTTTTTTTSLPTTTPPTSSTIATSTSSATTTTASSPSASTTTSTPLRSTSGSSSIAHSTTANSTTAPTTISSTPAPPLISTTSTISVTTIIPVEVVPPTVTTIPQSPLPLTTLPAAAA